jgi:hypothetical protein
METTTSLVQIMSLSLKNYFTSMRLQKAYSCSALKASDYSGYILNNAKIYDYISERTIKEDVFVKI